MSRLSPPLRMSPLPTTLRALLTMAAIGSLTTVAAAQESELSKSISSGWKSVVKQTQKAAKTVSKAADDALTPDKPKRKKSAKRKGGADKAVTAEGEASSDTAKPDAAKTSGRTSRDKAAAKSAPPSQPADARATEDEGPPVPLYREAAPAGSAGGSPAAGKTIPAKADAAARRLPPPPAVPSSAGNRNFGAGWSATSIDGDGKEIPQVDITPATAGKGNSAEPRDKPLPITMIPPKAGDATAPADTWSKEDIASAKANCDAILQNVAAVTVPEAPVREGACGAPAPVRLISIGKNPEIKLSPQPLVTCELVAGLAQWMQNDIQPLAKKHLGGSVIKIETMSDYSCRMAYGRKGNKLSEHGRANALDIRGFITAKGDAANVLEAWGKTQRDLVAEAAKIAAEKAAATQAAEAAAAAGAQSAVAEVADKGGDGATLAQRPQPAMASLGAIGLKPALHSKAEKAAAAIVPEAPHSKKAQFLRDAHTAACRIFGTSLGPESNEAHRNHFHVDMATRKRTKICE